MADVFISYARKDRDWVERLADVLERAGLSVWWDSRQRYGKSFEAQITEELGLAKAVIVIWSKASLLSDWVKDEAQDGRERGILVPILKDGVLPPLGFKQIHSADFTGWNGGPHKELAGVIDALRDLAGQSDRTVAITIRPRATVPAPLSPALEPDAIAPKPAPPQTGSHRSQPRLLGRLLSTMSNSDRTSTAAPVRPAERKPVAPPRPRREEGWRFEPGPVLQGGHEDAVAIAFAPGGATLATGSVDGFVRLWDVASGGAQAELTGHTAAVTIVQFSPSGESLVSGSEDTDGRLWAADGELLAILSGHTGALRGAAFAPDGVRLATIAEDDMPWLWDARSGAALTTLQGHEGNVCCVAFAPGGATLATSARDATARIWNARTGRELRCLKDHAEAVVALSYAPDGTMLATADAGGAVCLWDSADGSMRHRLGRLGAGIMICTFRPDGESLLTIAVDGTAALWDAATGARTPLLRQSARAVAAAFAGDGVLVTGHEDGTLTLWDGDGMPHATLAACDAAIRSLAFTADGATLASASGDGTARLWRVVRG